MISRAPIMFTLTATIIQDVKSIMFIWKYQMFGGEEEHISILLIMLN